MFKKLREVCRKHFHLVAPPKTSVVTSYDQKTTPGVLVVLVVLEVPDSLAPKFGFCEKFHRQNRLEMSGSVNSREVRRFFGHNS